MTKTIKLRIVYFILLLAWTILIFVFSSQNAEKSSNTSGAVVEVVIEKMYPQYKTLTKSEQTDITHTVTFFVRKTAHFLEYFILGVLSFLVTYTFDKYRFIYRVITAFLFCVVYSVSDEIHQYFVPGRACRIGDIFIDSIGSFFAVFILLIVILKSKSNKLRNINA